MSLSGSSSSNHFIATLDDNTRLSSNTTTNSLKQTNLVTRSSNIASKVCSFARNLQLYFALHQEEEKRSDSYIIPESFSQQTQRNSTSFKAQSPAIKEFEQQSNRYGLNKTNLYDSSHTDCLEGLPLFPNRHWLCFPKLTSEKKPFTEKELRQIIREVAIGIYTKDALPFVSLRIDQNGKLVPFVDPAYGHTLVGRTLSLWDYLLKCLLSGGTVSEEAIDAYGTGESPKDLIDFSEYFQKLEGENREYISLRKMIQTMNQITASFNKDQSEEKEEAESEYALFKLFKSCDNSFSIQIKQNNVQGTNSLLLFDVDFEVIHINRLTPEFQIALETHNRKYGRLPSFYEQMKLYYPQFCKQICDQMKMLSLPIWRELYAKCAVIGALSSYFLTLKNHGHVPLLMPSERSSKKGVPSLFPRPPIGTSIIEPLYINIGEILATLKTELTEHNFTSDADNPGKLEQAFKDAIKSNIISHATFRRAVKKNIDGSKEIQQFIKELAYKLYASIHEGFWEGHPPVGSEKDTFIANLSKIKNGKSLFGKTTVTTLFANEIDLEKDLKVIGECHVKIQKVSVIASELGKMILESNQKSFQSEESETWVEVESKRFQGHAFRLDCRSLPLNVDYSWLEHTLSPDNAPLDKKRIAIWNAMRLGKKEFFSKVVANTKPEDLDKMRDLEERSLTHLAASMEDPFYLKTLLSNRVSFSKDIYGYFPIHHAAMSKSTDVVALLLKEDLTKEKPEKRMNLRSSSNFLSKGVTPLDVAVQHGCLDTVAYLLSAGATLTSQSEGRNTLHIALQQGDFRILDLLLKSKQINEKLVNEENEERKTPLMVACGIGSLDLVRRLIDLKADPKKERFDGLTALEIAIRRNCNQLATYLLKHVDPSSKAIEAAARNGRVEIIGVLLCQKIFHQHRNQHKETALHTTIRFGNLEAAQLIVKQCKDSKYLSEKNENGETAFTLAAALGAFDLMEALLSREKVVEQQEFSASLKVLLRARYDSNIKNIFSFYNKQYTFTKELLQELAFTAAQAGNFRALSEIFVPLKVEFESIKGPNGWTIAHYLAKCDGLGLFKEVIKQSDLLQSLKAEDEKTLPYIAGMYGSTRVLQFLLECMQKQEKMSLERHFKDHHLFYGILESLNVKCVQTFLNIYKDQKEKLINTALDKSGLSPLLLATSKGSLPLVELLLKEGAKLRAKNKQRFDSLYLALRADASEVITYLLDKYKTTGTAISPYALYLAASNENSNNFQALIKINGSEKNSKRALKTLHRALYYSIKKNDFPAFKRLWQQGARGVFVSKNGVSALALAAHKGQDKMLKLLLEESSTDHTSYQGSNALHIAAQRGHIHCVDLLMNKGYKNEKEETLLKISTDNEHLKLFLESKESYTKRVTEFTSLIQNAQDAEGLKPLFSFITKLPVNLLLQIVHHNETIWGTPLQLVLRLLHQKGELKPFVVDLLQIKDLGLDFTIQDNNGDTLLHLLLQIDLFPSSCSKPEWTITNHKGQTALHLAASYASIKTLEVLLKAVTEDNTKDLLNTPDDYGRTPLFYAIETGRVEMVTLLIKSGANPNVYDYRLLTPLGLAIHAPSSLALCKRLHAGGADLNQRSQRISPLASALSIGEIEVARFLILNGADLDEDAKGNSIVHLATKLGLVDILKLCKIKGSLRVRDQFGLLPIHVAAKLGKTEVVEELVWLDKYSLEAPIEFLGEQEIKEHDAMKGAPPLYLAAFYNQKHTIRSLLALGANLNATTMKDKNVNVIVFASQNATRSTLEEFDSYKQTNEVYYKAAAQAISTDNLDAMCKMYEHLSIDIPIWNGLTGLHLACRLGAPRCTQWLLLQGADPLFLTKEEEDAFQLAAANSSFEQFRLLLEYGRPDINKLGNNGETLLHTAARAGNDAHVALLLQHSASPNIKDSRGMMPIDDILKKGVKIISLLFAKLRKKESKPCQ